MVVYVLSKDGRPLMPIHRPGKVRRLLNSGKAKVVRKEPFIIQLLFETGKEVSDLTLGVDTGSSVIGTAVVDKNQVVYYLSEVQIRNDISTKIKRRSAYRRTRRSKKLRYRKVRFKNRKNSIKKDRFCPTIISKINSHKREIEFIKTILPIKTLVLETGKFDITLLNHKDEAFNRHWGYQKGPNYGYKNVHEAVLSRDNYKCQCCKKKNSTLHVHHIIYRSNGGSDNMDNLITLCEDCHKKLHKGLLKDFESKLVGKRKGTLKYATQMNSIRIQLLREYQEAIETFGYITKANRELSELPKEHWSDAITIACGCIPKVKIKGMLYQKRHIAHGEYQLYQMQQSYKIKLPKRKVNSISLHDKLNYNGIIGFVKSRAHEKYVYLEDIFHMPIDLSYFPKGYKTPKISMCKIVQKRNTTLCMTKKLKEVI